MRIDWADVQSSSQCSPNQTMQQDLELAHQSIVQHPNVGPFIARQLIQKLVTGDPTPAYVARACAGDDLLINA